MAGPRRHDVGAGPGRRLHGSIDMGIRREQHIHTGTVLARQTYNNPGVVLLSFGNEHRIRHRADPARGAGSRPATRSSSRSADGSPQPQAVDAAGGLLANVIDDGHPYSGWYGKIAPQTWKYCEIWTPRRHGDARRIRRRGARRLRDDARSLPAAVQAARARTPTRSGPPRRSRSTT